MQVSISQVNTHAQSLTLQTISAGADQFGQINGSLEWTLEYYENGERIKEWDSVSSMKKDPTNQ